MSSRDDRGEMWLPKARAELQGEHLRVVKVGAHGIRLPLETAAVVENWSAPVNGPGVYWNIDDDRQYMIISWESRDESHVTSGQVSKVTGRDPELSDDPTAAWVKANAGRTKPKEYMRNQISDRFGYDPFETGDRDSHLVCIVRESMINRRVAYVLTERQALESSGISGYASPSNLSELLSREQLEQRLQQRPPSLNL